MENLFENLNVEKLKVSADALVLDLFAQWAQGIIQQKPGIDGQDLANELLIMTVQLDIGMMKIVPDKVQGKLQYLKTEYTDKTPSKEEILASYERVDLRLKQLMGLAIRQVLTRGHDPLNPN